MQQITINRLAVALLCLWVALSTTVAQPGVSSLRRQFLTPPHEARPWTFWYWMFGAVSKEGITADLEAMKQAGLGGTYLMPIKGLSEGPQYEGKAQQLSPYWWEMVRFSMQEADRLGLKLGMHICDGFALAGGPWISPSESMQKVVWSDTLVAGGTLRNLHLAQPSSYQGYYKDIALFAIPSEAEPPLAQPRITYAHNDTVPPANPSRAVNRDEKGVIRSSYPCYIQYEYEQPFTCRNIEVVLDGNNYQAHRLLVMAGNDGKNFYPVKQLTPARQGWQNTDEHSTHAIPPTTARYFRFYWTPRGSEPGSEDMDAAKWKPNLKIKELRLHRQARLHQWEGKAALVWRVAPATTTDEVPTQDCISPQRIIDLTPHLKNGTLNAALPPGTWKLLRMGHTATGHINATGGAGKGLECDKFTPATVRKQFDNWFAQAFAKTDRALASRVLKYMHVDSWECGSQNWSEGFAQEFRTRRGYDLLPWLPLLAGIPMESAARSEEILRDVRTTIAELVVDVFYKVLADCAREYDCQLSAECVSPTMVSDGMMHYRQVDLPMGEFWLNSPTHDKLNDMLDAISGARIYGKNIIQAEGFTEVRGTWDEHPAQLKTLLDRNYALGINRLFYHVYVHNPWLDKRPGMTLDGIGLFFQRDQTWWKQGAKALSTYAARCQALLQYGHPVVDVAVFTGEEIPRRAILPDRLVPSLPGIFGAARVESERVRLANEGEPLRVRPVGVTHAANMADPEKWIDPMRGYAYDSFNRDALLRLAQVKDGKITLPGGAQYRVLVLPLPRPMNPHSMPLSAEVQAKVAECRAAGVIVPELPYRADDFAAYGLERDMIVPEDIAWTHRKGPEADIYFIANQRDELRTFTADMRVSGSKPQCWNPVTGEICAQPSYQTANGRTQMELTLAPNESVFIVYEGTPTTVDAGNNVPQSQAAIAVTATTHLQPIEGNLMEQPYTLTFENTGKSITRQGLFDWSKEADEAIRYYSGTALYNTSFKWKGRLKSGERLYLDVGKVCNVATVRVNGTLCGTLWTAPYRIDITAALKRGTNQLEIEVTNTWVNALKGVDEGKAPFEGIWTNGKYRQKDYDVVPAGLLGPVTLVKQTTIKP